MKHLIKQGLSPNIFNINENIVKKLINSKDSNLFNEKLFFRLNDTTGKDVGLRGQFGYQKTNEDGIKYPLFYVTELHVFRSENELNSYVTAIITVSIDFDGNPDGIVEDIEIKSCNNYDDYKNIFSKDYKLPNYDDTIHFNNWIDMNKMLDYLKKENLKKIKKLEKSEKSVDKKKLERLKKIQKYFETGEQDNLEM